MTDDVTVLQAMVRDLSQDYPDRLTLLDHFAGLAMQGLAANEKHWQNINDDEDDLEEDDGGDGESLDDYYDRLARNSYDAAKAMLIERTRIMGINERSVNGGS